MTSLLLTLFFACGDKESDDTAAPAEEVQEETLDTGSEPEDTASEPEDSGEESSEESTEQ